MNDIDKMTNTYLGLLKNKDLETYQHSKRVGQRAYSFAQFLQLSPSEQRMVYYAGMLHDIGKLFIPNEILKKPSKLTNEEFAIVKMHPILGYQLFCLYFQNQQELSLSLIGEAILHHHEHCDGLGYPDGIYLQSCSIVTSIVSLCDVYEALIAERCYKSALSNKEALDIMMNKRGKQFNPQLLDDFIQFIKTKSNSRAKNPA